jgi:bifunctional ADP-heptose synthase (sugar kinase/adenylyltransferase)
MKILVIGDFIQDIYTFGTAARLCPEAPVPVLIPQSTRESNGGAGLVHEQLRELGVNALARFGSHSEKKRYFAGNHLICRIDQDSLLTGWDAPLEPSLEWADAYVIADYGKGAMTRELASRIVTTLKPVFVDAKHHWDWYTGPLSVAFPNEHEKVDAHNWNMVAQKLGAEGAMLCANELTKISASTDQVVDTTGAGDIFMAGFVYAWSKKFTPVHCLQFANALAGQSCRFVGTHVVDRGFAQAYLDRLRASEAPEQQGFARLSGSNELLRPQSQPQDHSPAVPLAAAGAGSLLEDCMSAAIDSLKLPGILPHAQTPQKSPSVPTARNVSQIQGDQQTVDLQGMRSRSEQQAQSPTSSERQCANTLMRDQD